MLPFCPKRLPLCCEYAFILDGLQEPYQGLWSS